MHDPSGDYDGGRMKHSAMFNLQHDYTVEFRQPKFVNAEQYMAVAKFARDCTNAIIENFIKTFVKCGTNTLLTPVFTPALDT